MLPVAHQGPTPSTYGATRPNPSRRTVWSSTPQPSPSWPRPSSVTLARYPGKHLRWPRPQLTACHNLYYGIGPGRLRRVWPACSYQIPICTLDFIQAGTKLPTRCTQGSSFGLLSYSRLRSANLVSPFAFYAQLFPSKITHQHSCRPVATIGVVARLLRLPF